MKGNMRLLAVLLIALWGFMSLTPQSVAGSETMDVLIAAKKPYDSLIQKVKALGGEVRFQYKHIDGLAVTIPVDRLKDLQSLPEVQLLKRDQTIRLEYPNVPAKEGYGKLPISYEAQFDQIKTIESPQALSALLQDSPQGFFPMDAGLTGALDFWLNTGRFGENVIVGIMDTGVMEAEAIQGRIIGGENFTGDGVPATSTANLGHGTFVATAVGANAVFLFNPSSSFAQAVKRYLPSAVIPNYGGTGLDAIPMVGIAPFCQFYALKIFDVNGFTSNSIILAAFDRTIELKDKYNRGEPGGVNIQVLNGSFGGASLFAGDDPFFAAMVGQLQDVGIVTCFSAGNSGPAGMTVGDPGLARNNLTVGASSIAAYEKIAIDLIYGFPGLGDLWRANDTHQTAVFSSRGPTPDGRYDPDIIAPGDWIYGQPRPGFISLSSGTSFSSPMVAGAAALLLSAHSGASPDQVRGALLRGADPDILEDDSERNDQGFGFLDVYKAHQIFGVSNPKDKGAEKSKVGKNLKKLGIQIYGDDHFVVDTDWLLPGEREEIFFRTLGLDRRVIIHVSVMQELPPSQQNPIWGDDILFTLTSAKTSFGDYRASGFVANMATFTMEEQDIEFGISRITVTGDWTNAGRVKARIEVTKQRAIPGVLPVTIGTVTQGEIDAYNLYVPPGAPELNLALAWDSHWGRWPTNDLDVIIFDPNGNLVIVNNDFDFDIDGLSLDTPEKVIIQSPMPGNWTLLVSGFTIWDGIEQYALLAGIPGMIPKVSESGGKDMITALPTKFDVAQNYPNPFNPSTQINYQLPEASHVTIQIYDIRGNLVRVLEDGRKQAGYHSVIWDGRNDSGIQVSSGVYIYKVKAGENVISKRMMMVK